MPIKTEAPKESSIDMTIGGALCKPGVPGVRGGSFRSGTQRVAETGSGNYG